jgi:hypothetical protein
MLCLYPVLCRHQFLPFASIRVAKSNVTDSENFIYFEVCGARMVTIRHRFDPEEFQAHESF